MHDYESYDSFCFFAKAIYSTTFLGFQSKGHNGTISVRRSALWNSTSSKRYKNNRHAKVKKKKNFKS